jgi:hypothetical protein
MLVVVSPPLQGLGIGTELVHTAIAVATERGFERIWLPVEASNLRARHIYQKCGFQYVNHKLCRELDMVCDLAKPPRPVPAPSQSEPSAIRIPHFLDHSAARDAGWEAGR